MVDMTKQFLKKAVLKNLEYQDYNNSMTIFITIIVTLFVFFFSTGILFWSELIAKPIWIIVLLIIFMGFELIFFFLLFYYNKQKKDKKSEIERMR